MIVKLANVRLAFADLFEARDFNNDGKFKFGASLLYEPSSENEEKVRKAIAAVAKEQWKDKAKAELSALVKKDRTCLHDGADKDYEGFEGMLYVSTSNPSRPTVVDRQNRVIDKQGNAVDKHGDIVGSADGKPYAGCYAHAIIDIWAQDNQWGKRVNATLSGVKFFKDGEAFAGGRAASVEDFEDEEFEDSPEDEDDEFSDLL